MKKQQINFLSILHQYEVLIASGAVILLVIFLTFNMLLPNLNRANQIYAQEQSLRKKMELLTQKDNILSSLDSQYYKDAFVKSNQVLPESKDYVSLISTFDFLERQANVTVVRTDFQLGVISTSSANLVKSADTPAYVIPITIEVMGDLQGLGKFLDLVSNYNGRLMIFDNVSVNNKQNNILSAAFSGQAFFYPLPTTLGPIDSPLPRLEKNQEAILTKISLLNLPTETSVELDKKNVGKKNLFQ